MLCCYLRNILLHFCDATPKAIREIYHLSALNSRSSLPAYSLSGYVAVVIETVSLGNFFDSHKYSSNAGTPAAVEKIKKPE